MLGVSYQQVQKYESGQNRISAGALCFLLDEFESPDQQPATEYELTF